MAMLGAQHETVLFQSQVGKIKTHRSHEYLKFFEPLNGHPMRVMVDHIFGGINYATSLTHYDKIVMAGLSGGGWSTTLVAAIDSRISLSMSVAGSLPISMRTVHPRNFGDWEQQEHDLYSVASYWELYLLAAENGRKHTLIYNELDSCCFGGQGIMAMAAPLAQSAFNLNGEIKVLVQKEEAGHIISKKASDDFLKEAQSQNIRKIVP